MNPVLGDEPTSRKAGHRNNEKRPYHYSQQFILSIMAGSLHLWRHRITIGSLCNKWPQNATEREIEISSFSAFSVHLDLEDGCTFPKLAKLSRFDARWVSFILFFLQASWAWVLRKPFLHSYQLTIGPRMSKRSPEFFPKTPEIFGLQTFSGPFLLDPNMAVLKVAQPNSAAWRWLQTSNLLRFQKPLPKREANPMPGNRLAQESSQNYHISYI